MAPIPFPRMNSGIPGLDDMIEGGFPFPSVILVAGSAGAGKTTFAQRFLFAGAEKGEQCLFFSTLSEPAQWMLRYSSQFEFVKPEYYGKSVIYEDLGTMLRNCTKDQLLEYIDNKVAEVMPQRIVIDPITVVGTMLKDDYRLFAFELTTRLKNWQATTLLTYNTMDSIMRFFERYGELVKSSGRHPFLSVLAVDNTLHQSLNALIQPLCKRTIDLGMDMSIKNPGPPIAAASSAAPTGPEMSPGFTNLSQAISMKKEVM